MGTSLGCLKKKKVGKKSFGLLFVFQFFLYLPPPPLPFITWNYLIFDYQTNYNLEMCDTTVLLPC